MEKLGGAGISVELEAQTAAKLAGRQCPEGHVLLRKQGTGSLPQDRGCSLGTPGTVPKSTSPFCGFPCVLVSHKYHITAPARALLQGRNKKCIHMLANIHIIIKHCERPRH